MMQIRDIMSTEFYRVTPDAKLADVLHHMVEKRYSCVLVTDGCRLLGIVTEQDVTALFSNYCCDGRAPDVANQPVKNVMTKAPIYVFDTDNILEVIVIAKSSHVRHFPVINNTKELVGLITQIEIISTYNVLVNMLNNLIKDNTKLQALALEDPLMNIGNRRAMEIDLKHSQSLATRRQLPYAIAIFDVDFFKKYNDSYGHQKGDDVLVAIADTMKSVVRDSDRIYRYGGEEILILMPETNAKQAMEIAIRVRQNIAHLNIEHKDTERGLLTISGGVVSGQEAGWEQMIKTADKMLYIAKTSGRNQVCVA